MSINLSELKRNELRKTIKTNDVDHPVEIYNPTPEQRNKILKLLIKSTRIQEERGEYKAVTGLTDEDMILVMLEELTNIHLDLDKFEDRDKIISIIQDPSELLIEVKYELEKILMEISTLYIRTLKDTISLPDEMTDEIYELLEKKEQVEQGEDEVTKMMNEMKEMQDRLNALKEKVNA
ncbi:MULTISPECIES: hypothetical protein [unclassified Clostridium]|uniref:hypothetical protein n=1 Tax=unclassified Clostridium TaxID=2614128 RepID=UPI0025C09B24|nr:MULTISPECIES: hypothetical protein [unclassified Clostridium]